MYSFLLFSLLLWCFECHPFFILDTKVHVMYVHALIHACTRIIKIRIININELLIQWFKILLSIKTSLSSNLLINIILNQKVDCVLTYMHCQFLSTFQKVSVRFFFLDYIVFIRMITNFVNFTKFMITCHISYYWIFSQSC